MMNLTQLGRLSRAARGRYVVAATATMTQPIVSGIQHRVMSSGVEKAQEQARKWQAQTAEDKAKFLSVRVDRSALKLPRDAMPVLTQEAQDSKSKETDLVHILRTMIEVKGPITVAEFMSRALGHPEHGYYMKKDVFGVKGDFTTAPEISQMFGELIGVWCVATWQQMGQPTAIKIVEMGPGRGSLMSDFLRSAAMFPAFYNALEIHMVEMSPALREIQQRTLHCEPLDESEAQTQTTANTSSHSKPVHKMKLPNNGPTVQWHEELGTVPQGPTLFIAQELFDALPAHQFEYTTKGWCERLVDVDYSGDSDDHFRFVLSPGPTPATRVYIGRQKLFDPQAPLPSPSASMDSPTSPIQRLDVADLSAPVTTAQAQVGDRIEISPVSIALAQDVAKRVSEHGGGALIVDYGHDHPAELSLRGIQNHAFVSVLREPGEVDLSIDVDFSTLRKYATQQPGVHAFGPIGQGEFLKNMGIEHRLGMLMENCATEAEQDELFAAAERLVNDDQMGAIFKAMAITNTQVGRPVGFEQAKETVNGADATQ